jgi:tRNA modification GTPase
MAVEAVSPVSRALPGSDDTIAAIATAQGRSALALLRLSGPRAEDIARTVVHPWPRAVRRATLSTISDPRTGSVLDRGIVTWFAAPHSYTGEPLVEMTTHGGAVVPATVLAGLISAGARIAMPGEFTRRAVLNGRMDLAQAEAVGDLVDARSRQGQRIALAQLDGGLSRRILILRGLLLDIEAMIAYDLDFPSEDDGPIPATRITAACDEVLGALQSLRNTGGVGELVREGAVVVLAGAPNVGKSSLFNALIGQTRAIVTDEPGTTRDALEAVIDVGDWALRVVDTAGLREAADRIEQLGIEMSERYLGGAAVVLACGDSLETLRSVLSRVENRTAGSVIAVRTKGDRGDSTSLGRELVALGYECGREPGARAAVIVSTWTGQGLDDLVQAITGTLNARHGALPIDAPVLVRERHRRAVGEAIREIGMFRDAWIAGATPVPVMATHLRGAVSALEDLIGGVDVEDILDRVFRTFCVGK